MIKALVIGLALALGLIAAGSGSTSPAAQAARAIPWDCSDWQAFAHDNRTTSILESLAANRGKTLYCAIDQSDTFTKAETWEAGKDRNERDDTVYQGEQGRFRGFIAAQEGWLTEGESGITGMSIDRIFEFPREEKKRRRRTVRPNLVYDREYPTSTLPVPGLTANGGGPTTGYLAPDLAGVSPYTYVSAPRSLWNGYVRVYGAAGATSTTDSVARTNAETEWNTNTPTDAEVLNRVLNGSGETVQAERGVLEVPGGANEECQALGYARATKPIKWWWSGNLERDTVSGTSPFQYRMYRTVLYTARCVGSS